MSEIDQIKLYEDDVAVVITEDGEFYGILAHENEAHEDADLIHEMMIAVIKEEDDLSGFWSWRIKKDESCECEFLMDSIDE